MNIIEKATKINTKQDVFGFYKSLLLFIYMFVGEQITTVVYYISVNFQAKAIGLLLSLVIAWLFIKTAISYQSNYESFQPLEGVTKKIIGYITILYIASIVWSQVGPKLLNLNLNGQTSQNQSSVLSFLSDSWSTIFIVIMTVIIAPILEEFCFRYLIIKPKRQSYNLLRLIISIISFAFMHVGEQFTSVINHQLTFPAWFFYFSQYAIIGIVLVITYNKYRNYKLNVLIHASWNLIAIITAIILHLSIH